MKPLRISNADVENVVASHAEAWIETRKDVVQATVELSPPTRRRGLKPIGNAARLPPSLVASHAEAWIETWLYTLRIALLLSRLPRGGVD